MKLISLAVNPMFGYGNLPDISGLVDKVEMPDKSTVYNYKDSLYYNQREDGFTHFYAHSGKLIPTDDPNEFETNNLGGFGGSNYRHLVMIDGKVVTVNARGPWSSGWHYANHVLPRKVFGIALSAEVGYGWGGYHIDLELAATKLPNGWSFKFNNIPGKSWLDIELVHNGRSKCDIPDGELKILQENFNHWQKGKK